jgi:hypothetical protein
VQGIGAKQQTGVAEGLYIARIPQAGDFEVAHVHSSWVTGLTRGQHWTSSLSFLAVRGLSASSGVRVEDCSKSKGL